ncbi:MAG: DUF721 domain-containing protein [Deltaproteobacteria bacterium]|nr:DUF721 domain-containing protein [Deltaproteobacteria bacterium]
MSKPSSFSNIKDILKNLAKDGKWEKEQKRFELWEKWEEVVGANIARHAKPSKWQSDQLIVETTDSCWLQELRMMEEELLEKIKKSYPNLKIRGIRWKLA